MRARLRWISHRAKQSQQRDSAPHRGADIHRLPDGIKTCRSLSSDQQHVFDPSKAGRWPSASQVLQFTRSPPSEDNHDVKFSARSDYGHPERSRKTPRGPSEVHKHLRDGQENVLNQLVRAWSSSAGKSCPGGVQKAGQEVGEKLEQGSRTSLSGKDR